MEVDGRPLRMAALVEVPRTERMAKMAETDISKITTETVSPKAASVALVVQDAPVRMLPYTEAVAAAEAAAVAAVAAVHQRTRPITTIGLEAAVQVVKVEPAGKAHPGVSLSITER